MFWTSIAYTVSDLFLLLFLFVTSGALVDETKVDCEWQKIHFLIGDVLKRPGAKKTSQTVNRMDEYADEDDLTGFLPLET